MSEETGKLPDEEIQFAAGIKLLEEIVKSLESGELSLEESLRKFEEGIRLARKLEAVLERSERRVQEILKEESAEPEER